MNLNLKSNAYILQYFQDYTGYVFAAANAQELVNELADISKVYHKDLQDYMESTARRCYNWNKSTIRTDTYKIFILDLVKSDFIKIKSQELF